MRLLNEPLSQPPSWLDELRISLLTPDRHWSPDGTLDLLSAGNEFEDWLHDQREYQKRHEQGWVSAIADFATSAREIGPRLKRALRPDLRHALETADSLRADIQSKSPAVLKTYLPSRLPNDRTTYAAFKARWGEPAVRTAAWDDFVAACADATTDHDTLAHYRDLFWQFMRTADYDPERLSNLLAGALSDYEFYLAPVRRWLGDSDDEPVSAPLPIDATAGLTEDERLALCHRIITQEPIKAHRVIWLAFDRVGHSFGVQDLGAVAFWDDQLVRQTLAGQGPNWDVIPAELRTTQTTFGPGDLPEGQDVIWARVDLQFGAFTDPVRLAAEQAESVVALAGFRAEELRWRRLDGYLDFADGRLYGRSTFAAPDQLDDMVVPGYTEFMLAELDRMAPGLKPHLPITDPQLTELVQAIRWWQQARTQPPVAALLLDVRVLELIASRLDTKWEEYIERYLASTWIRLVVMATLKNTVHDALYRREQLMSDADRERLAEHRTAVITHVRGGFTTDPVSCLASLPDLAAMFPLHTRLGRRLRSLDRRLASVDSLNNWAAELNDEWTRRSQRLIRLRNSLAHGGPFHDDGIARTYRFGQGLAANALSLALEGLLQGQDMLAVHVKHARLEDASEQRRHTAANVGEALFGPG
jgi:hypothetical protein